MPDPQNEETVTIYHQKGYKTITLAEYEALKKEETKRNSFKKARNIVISTLVIPIGIVLVISLTAIPFIIHKKSETPSKKKSSGVTYDKLMKKKKK